MAICIAFSCSFLQNKMSCVFFVKRMWNVLYNNTSILLLHTLYLPLSQNTFVTLHNRNNIFTTLLSLQKERKLQAYNKILKFYYYSDRNFASFLLAHLKKEYLTSMPTTLNSLSPNSTNFLSHFWSILGLSDVDEKISELSNMGVHLLHCLFRFHEKHIAIRARYLSDFFSVLYLLVLLTKYIFMSKYVGGSLFSDDLAKLLFS